MLDAPPTGRIAQFLNVNSEVAGLAKVGPIRNHADLVMGVIRSPRTAVHLVTLLEEMPVQETIDGIDELRAQDLPVGSVIVNMTRSPMLDDVDLALAARGELPQTPIAEALASIGLDAGLATTLAVDAADHASRIALERRERARIDALGLSTATLPMMVDGIDLGALYGLADALRGVGFR